MRQATAQKRRNARVDYMQLYSMCQNMARTFIGICYKSSAVIVWYLWLFAFFLLINTAPDMACSHDSGVLTCCFFFQAEDGIRDSSVTGVQTCALPISQDVLVEVPGPVEVEGGEADVRKTLVGHGIPPRGVQYRAVISSATRATRGGSHGQDQAHRAVDPGRGQDRRVLRKRVRDQGDRPHR